MACQFASSHKCLLLEQFLLDLNDSRVILTRIVSRIWTCFWRNLTIIAWMVTILVWVIKVYTVTFSLGGTQPAALGLIGPSWRHQNRLCSVNVVHSSRSNQTWVAGVGDARGLPERELSFTFYFWHFDLKNVLNTYNFPLEPHMGMLSSPYCNSKPNLWRVEVFLIWKTK